MTNATVTPSFNINGMVVDASHKNYTKISELMERKTTKLETMKKLKGEDLEDAKDLIVVINSRIDKALQLTSPDRVNYDLNYGVGRNEVLAVRPAFMAKKLDTKATKDLIASTQDKTKKVWKHEAGGGQVEVHINDVDKYNGKPPILYFRADVWAYLTEAMSDEAIVKTSYKMLAQHSNKGDQKDFKSHANIDALEDNNGFTDDQLNVPKQYRVKSKK